MPDERASAGCTYFGSSNSLLVSVCVEAPKSIEQEPMVVVLSTVEACAHTEPMVWQRFRPWRLEGEGTTMQ